jgi:hypothetical protein
MSESKWHSVAAFSGGRNPVGETILEETASVKDWTNGTQEHTQSSFRFGNQLLSYKNSWRFNTEAKLHVNLDH